ncbi:tetratricopeptide repeat protein [Qipengyuania sp. YG27]|uniref:Tetratricopeptide repeat protein n=1 Tax=Qipengyuania mesophila TaxID=2867246 RepID=A0ABS7JWP1_9SPHN|nr:tetratricopeptide repeat protein [Qipengyuania mesophila]MBX7502002.1 tetratricopeptide repeat protein [Qipengyuania mesophila]
MISNRRLATAAALLAVTAHAPPAAAQREIVQPLPGEGERKLSEALSRLARNAADTNALLDAGEAALQLGDIDAAIGFFGRANELSPGNPRTKLGLARAYTRSRRPIEALRLFAEAEKAGAPLASMAEDRGLAFDLVGDAASAQHFYRLALANGAGAEATRRLALSQAITGDRKGFEATLLPLLEKRDVTAYRTRAFGLAILGEARAAKEIADTMLPAGVGSRMAAYFDYMPRLTKAQQAAAANLGIFPRTASIGTDDAEIAGYSPPPPQLARADTAPAQPVSASATAASDPRNRQNRRRPDMTRSRAVSATPIQRQEREPSSPASPPPTPVPPQATNIGGNDPAPAGESGASRATPVVIAQAEPDMARSATNAPPPSPAPSPTPTPSPAPTPSPEPGPASVADAFSGFTLEPQAPAPAASGAVDITRIDIPRERAAPKPPPPPAYPSRHWVQVATGKDTDALKFDWRRITRKAEGKLDGKGPFVTPWGEANRLLSGPFDSAESAREMVNELRKLGLDSFPFTSAEGEKIDKL